VRKKGRFGAPFFMGGSVDCHGVAHADPCFLRGPAPRCLTKIGAREPQWAMEVRGVGSRYWRAVGHADRLLALAEQLGQRWLKGVAFARALSKA